MAATFERHLTRAMQHEERLALARIVMAHREHMICSLLPVSPAQALALIKKYPGFLFNMTTTNYPKVAEIVRIDAVVFAAQNYQLWADELRKTGGLDCPLFIFGRAP